MVRDVRRLVRNTVSSPGGPKGEKRPADVNARAIMMGKIATGEIEDATTEDGKNAAAVALGRMGGRARAAKLNQRKKREIAKKGGEGPLGPGIGLEYFLLDFGQGVHRST